MSKYSFLLSALLCFAFVFGCAKTYRGEFNKLAEEERYTKEQKKVSLEYSYRILFGDEQSDGTFRINFGRLPLKEVRERVENYLEDIDWVLNYQDSRMAKYLETFRLREYFERKERVFKLIYARLRAAELYTKFKELTGQTTWSRLQEDRELGYEPKIFFIEDLSKEYPFSKTEINEARKNGFLKEIERYSVSHYRKYDRKEPDPNFPDDPHRFVWKTKKYQLRVSKYKVIVGEEKPKDNYGNYMEVFRLRDDGTEESAPALKAFLDERGKDAVVVLDKDREGDIGFGLPDEVEKISENDILSSNMISKIFPDKKNHRRIKPQKPPQRVEIARVGEAVDVWEKAKSGAGWQVPFSYKMEPNRDNFNVYIEFYKEKERRFKKNRKKIMYIKKQWTSGNRYKPSPGNVVEYFKPKPPYNEELIMAEVLHNEDTKKLRFLFPNGTEKIGFITPGSNIFIKDKPEAIAFTLGEKRWFIFDEDGDGVYEKRKQVSETEKTGYY